MGFSKELDSTYREKMEQILLAYSLSKETYNYNDTLQKHESNGLLTNEDTNLLNMVT